MIEYEKKLSEFILKQIFKIFETLFISKSDIPKYKIIFNFETELGVNQYLFENLSFQYYQAGLKIRGDYISYVYVEEEDDIILMADLCEEYEYIVSYHFRHCRLHVCLDTPKKPYVNLFLNYIIGAYFETKEMELSEILDNPTEYKDVREYTSKRFSLGERSIFNALNCQYEEELIISKAVSYFFYHTYYLDVNIFTLLSCQTYEGSDANCEIIIPRIYSGRGKRNLELSIKLRNPIYFGADEIRRIRKIMEIAKPPLKALLNHKKYIIGFTESDVRKNESVVSILGKLNWKMSLRYADLIFSGGVYRLSWYNSYYPYEFSKQILEITERQNKKINKIVEIVKRQTHGTTLIFSNTECIKREANRLAKYERGMLISPMDVDKRNDVVLNLSSIDGAMMLDYDCKCYAIGAILDGDAVVQGRTERGARYNSAKNYVERQKRDGNIIFAIIISEDKTIDYIFGSKV